MNTPNCQQVALLKLAVKQILPKDYKPYLNLRLLLKNKPPGFRLDFEREFKSYYGMNRAHLGSDFHRIFFRYLFALKLPSRAEPYSRIVRRLFRYPRLRGDCAPQFSFVSKLVAIHDESQPIFDSHVSDFFGISAPAIGGIKFRIAGFISNLTYLRGIYSDWATDRFIAGILSELKGEHPGLNECSETRLLDLLVWTVGQKKLGNRTELK